MTGDKSDIARTTALMRTEVLEDEEGTIIQTARLVLTLVLCTELEQTRLPSGIFLLAFPSQGLQRALVPEPLTITLSLRARITPHL